MTCGLGPFNAPCRSTRDLCSWWIERSPSQAQDWCARTSAAAVGAAWLDGTDGSCRFCRRGQENLCTALTFTGWDVDGGYAEYCLVDEAYAYALPPAISDGQAAPLLCAGIIGYRALRAAAVPPGGVLGIYGFGGSAHLTAQLALHQGLTVHVLTRGANNRKLATDLGVDSVGDATAAPPEPLDGAILFAPAGELVPVAPTALTRGGTLAVAGIWLSDIPTIDYAKNLSASAHSVP